jgi:hypothetical protein
LRISFGLLDPMNREQGPCNPLWHHHLPRRALSLQARLSADSEEKYLAAPQQCLRSLAPIDHLLCDRRYTWSLVVLLAKETETWT